MQFRDIEIVSTDFRNLLISAPEDPVYINDLYKFIYWKQGAVELATQQKTLPLRQFDQYYKQQRVFFPNLWTEDELRTWGQAAGLPGTL